MDSVHSMIRNYLDVDLPFTIIIYQLLLLLSSDERWLLFGSARLHWLRWQVSYAVLSISVVVVTCDALAHEDGPASAHCCRFICAASVFVRCAK